MQIFENISLATSGLKSNKMRALLTMLGIIIGIGSVIAIVMVGNSLTTSITSSMQTLGATNIIVAVQEKSQGFSGGPEISSAPSYGEDDLITDEMIESFEKLYSNDIETVSISQSGGSGKAQDGRRYGNLSITGINEGYTLANNVEISKGRSIRESDIKSERFVVVISEKTAEKMFPNEKEVLGKEIKVTTGNQIENYTIVGIYKHVDDPMSGFGMVPEEDISREAYIPISTCQKVNSLDKGYSMLTVMAKTTVDSASFSKIIKDFFNTFYLNNAKFEIMSMSLESAMSVMTTMLGTISIAISVIAGISLLVGGIGVMNIMLVSVTERTREIGTRKALGAKNGDIMVQFIIESVIICVIGGIIGIILGITLGYFGASLLGYPAQPSLDIIIISVMFSMFIGIFFGYYPAKQAAKLDPIEALRYE